MLRTHGEVFPYSTGSTRVDHDHVTPDDPLGPPGRIIGELSFHRPQRG